MDINFGVTDCVVIRHDCGRKPIGKEEFFSSLIDIERLLRLCVKLLFQRTPSTRPLYVSLNCVLMSFSQVNLVKCPDCSGHRCF